MREHGSALAGKESGYMTNAKPPPPLETHFCEGGGGSLMLEKRPSLVSSVLNSTGFVWNGVGRALVQFMQFACDSVGWSMYSGLCDVWGLLPTSN